MSGRQNVLDAANSGPNGEGTAREYVDNFVLPPAGMDPDEVGQDVFNQVYEDYGLNGDDYDNEAFERREQLARAVIEAIMRRAIRAAQAEANRLAAEAATVRRAEQEARARELSGVMRPHFDRVRSVNEVHLADAAATAAEAYAARLAAEAESIRRTGRAARANTSTTINATIASLADPDNIDEPDTNVLGECGICLAPMGPRYPVVKAHNPNPNNPGEAEHLFHKKCLLKECSTSREPKCPLCRVEMNCAAINRGDMDVPVNVELPRTGGKRIKSSCSCIRKSKRRHVKKGKKITRKGKKGKKYTNKRMRRRRM